MIPRCWFRAHLHRHVIRYGDSLGRQYSGLLGRRGDVYYLSSSPPPLQVLLNIILLCPDCFLATARVLTQFTYALTSRPGRAASSTIAIVEASLVFSHIPQPTAPGPRHQSPPPPRSPPKPQIMAPLAAPDQNTISSLVQQSAPVDVSAPYTPTTLRGKTILLTGGASGLGAAFARSWASHGAHLVVGDVNDEAGALLVAELRAATGSPHHHFVRCDVTSWPSQASLFREAVRLSPTGELDAVVSSAGVSDAAGTITGRGFENPAGLDAPDPPAPDLRCVEINLIGTMYTAHLALFWLRQDAPTRPSPAAAAAADVRDARDRHLLLIGSSAGLSFLPGVPQYVTSKHGVTGLFRSLRTLSYRQGVRVNMLCPYFIDTAILPNRAVAMLAGLGLGRLDDTVDAATRFVSCAGGPNGRIAGRALVVGPRARLLRSVLPEGELGREGGDAAEPNEGGGDVVADEDTLAGRGQGVWEVYGHDFETVDFFIRRYIRLLNTIAAIKGWIAFWREIWYAVFVRKDPKPARLRA